MACAAARHLPYERRRPLDHIVAPCRTVGKTGEVNGSLPRFPTAITSPRGAARSIRSKPAGTFSSLRQLRRAKPFCFVLSLGVPRRMRAVRKSPKIGRRLDQRAGELIESASDADVLPNGTSVCPRPLRTNVEQRVSDRPSQAADLEPLVVRPKVAWKMLGCGNTRGYELLAAGELESYKDGRSRKITVVSIKGFVARQLASAHSRNPGR